MKAATVVGIILIILGIVGFILGGFSFTKKEKIADLGPLEIQTEETETVAIPSVLSGIAIVGGIVLVVAGSRKSRT